MWMKKKIPVEVNREKNWSLIPSEKSNSFKRTGTFRNCKSYAKHVEIPRKEDEKLQHQRGKKENREIE